MKHSTELEHTRTWAFSSSTEHVGSCPCASSACGSEVRPGVGLGSALPPKPLPSPHPVAPWERRWRPTDLTEVQPWWRTEDRISYWSEIWHWDLMSRARTHGTWLLFLACRMIMDKSLIPQFPPGKMAKWCWPFIRHCQTEIFSYFRREVTVLCLAFIYTL